MKVSFFSGLRALQASTWEIVTRYIDGDLVVCSYIIRNSSINVLLKSVGDPTPVLRAHIFPNSGQKWHFTSLVPRPRPAFHRLQYGKGDRLSSPGLKRFTSVY